MSPRSSILSHAFPCNPTAMYPHETKLIKPYVPMLDGQEAIAPPNLISLSSDFQRRYADLSIGKSLKKNEMMSFLLLSELTELDLDLLSNADWFPNLFNYSNCQNISHQPLVDCCGDMLHCSEIMFLNDNRVLSRENATELEEYMAALTEVYRFKSLDMGTTKTYLVPSPYRFNDAKADVTAPEIAPFPLSPGKVKGNNQRRKKEKRSLNGERDGYKRGYSHACESLLTLMMRANQRHDDGSVVTVVRSAPEIPALLTQISACVAGTGLAVVFFAVAWMVNSSDVSRFGSLGVGLGLMWIAWGVIKLRNAIALIGKRSGEAVADVGRILKEIYFGFAVLMSFAVMKLG